MKLSLKEKAVIGIIAVVIPILITFALVYGKNRIYLKSRVLHILSVIAESYEGQVYQFLEKGKIRAQDFASDGFIRTYLQKALRGNTTAISKLNKHLVRNKLSLDGTINTINILSMDGRVVASTKSSEMGKDLSKDACFEEGRHAPAILERRPGGGGLFIQKLQQDGKPAYLEVNLSGRSFADKKLLPLIKDKLSATNVDPANLVFEITETVLIENMMVAQHFIAELKLLGCRFALDDFGIGFSSFNYLKHLSVDYLKIDGSFISNLPHNTVDQHLVKAMVEVASGLGKKTIAESIENEETLNLLKKHGRLCAGLPYRQAVSSVRAHKEGI